MFLLLYIGIMQFEAFLKFLNLNAYQSSIFVDKVEIFREGRGMAKGDAGCLNLLTIILQNLCDVYLLEEKKKVK